MQCSTYKIPVKSSLFSINNVFCECTTDFPELSIPTAVEPEGSNFSFAWEYKNWSKLSGQLQEHLRFGHLLPESHPQKFDYSCLDAQLKLYNLQPSKYSWDLYRLFESKETVSGYFSLTIAGRCFSKLV